MNENSRNLGEIRRLQEEIEKILEQEDTKWKQRAKLNWYKHGDRNTSYFHAWATQRRNMSRIVRIHDATGVERTTQAEVSSAFTQYFQSLFTTGGTTGVEECLVGVYPRITEDMNNYLVREFFETEVRESLDQMALLKSPGPDGFAASFYQSSWDTIGEEVCNAALGFLNHGVFDPVINKTFIALIPKKKKPYSVTEYRPISLCNVCYKLIAKTLANRLKKVLNGIISLYQSAFIPGRLITDNVLVAFEALHTMNGRLKGRKGFMALKLEMSKAYDRVEWKFLEKIMEKMGFASRWI